MSANMAFVVFRQQLGTIHGGVLHQEEGTVSTHMVQWVEQIPTGSIVIAKGKPQKSEEPVRGCTKHDVEILVREFYMVARRPEAVPFTVYEDEVSGSKELDEEAG